MFHESRIGGEAHPFRSVRTRTHDNRGARTSGRERLDAPSVRAVAFVLISPRLTGNWPAAPLPADSSTLLPASRPEQTANDLPVVPPGKRESCSHGLPAGAPADMAGCGPALGVLVGCHRQCGVCKDNDRGLSNCDLCFPHSVFAGLWPGGCNRCGRAVAGLRARGVRRAP